MRYHDGSKDGVYSGILKKLGYTATNTYTRHVFSFHELVDGKNDPHASPGEEVKKHFLPFSTTLQYLSPFEYNHLL
jgi:hypothetical protein